MKSSHEPSEQIDSLELIKFPNILIHHLFIDSSCRCYASRFFILKRKEKLKMLYYKLFIYK